MSNDYCTYSILDRDPDPSLLHFTWEKKPLVLELRMRVVVWLLQLWL